MNAKGGTQDEQDEKERRNESQYARSLIEASLDPLVTISPEGKITDVNEGSIKVTGVRREELIGTDFSNYFTDPDKAREGYRQVFAKGFVTDYPLTIRHRDGRLTDVLYNASVYKDVSGKVLGVFAAARDVTAQKQASQYARSLIEASLDPLVTISPEGKITDVNEGSIKVTGVRREELIGTDFSNYFTDPDKAREGYRQVFAKGFVTDYPLTIRHRDGRLTDVLYNASVYKDVSGKVLGVFAAARDVTESTRVMRELAETKNFLDNILQSSTKYSIIGKDIGQRVLSWNEGARRNYGYRAEEILGKNSEILHTPKDIESGAVAKLLATANEKGLAEGEFERVRKDGSHFMASVVVTRRNDASGRPIGYLLMSTDISEKKQVEEKLRFASQYARSLIEASLDPLVTISPEGKITDVNEATMQVTGVPRQLLVGSDFSDYFTQPDKARAGYREVFTNGFVTDYPLTLRHVSGRVRDVLYNASLYHNEKGEVAGVFAAARDITERKRAEEELRAASLYARSLIEASLDPLVTISVDGKITDVNEATIQVTGVPRKLLVGSDFSGYFTEPEKARAGYQEAFSKGFVTDYPLALRHVSGKITEVLYNANVYRNEAGKVLGVFAAARDITERKRAEDQLRKYHEHLEELVQERTRQLEAANEDLEGFAYSVSHDLRTPLRAIDGFSYQVLKRYGDALDDEGKRYLNLVHDNTKKMSRLIDDILAFSRMGRLGMSVSEVNMEELAREVFAELSSLATGRDLTVEIKPLPRASGDYAMLRQVWVNLLANAIKFTFHKPSAAVQVGAYTEGKENVYFVKDNGAGFDMQYADKLFGVFQRLHGNEEFEGTGIGLAIVKRIIIRHAGRIWAEGKVNEGATVYFALPF